MARTRRGVLSGAAVLATALAGCNDQSDGSSDGTVTPVDVPMTDEELLAAAASIDRPSIPSAVVVTDEHLSTAIEHGESMVTTVEAGLGTLEERDASDHPGPFRGDAGALAAEASEQLTVARDRGASEAGLESAQRAVRTIAPLYGYVRAAVDDVDPSDLRRELESVRDSRSSLREEFRYGLGEPLPAYLPTLYAAEVALAHEIDTAGPTSQLSETDPSDDRYPRLAAEVQMRIELHRRERDDAAQFLETATDPGSPSIEPAIEAAFRDAQSELDRIKDEYHLDDRERPDRSTLRGEIRDQRYRAGARSWEVRFRAADEFEYGWRVKPLLDAVEGVLAFEAVDEAVAVTLDRLDRGGFPTERVVSEKRRAVANLEAVAEANALQRHLADGSESSHHLDGSSTSWVLAGDRIVERGETDVESIAIAHVNYVQAASRADLAIARGSRLSSSLQG